MIIKKKIKSLSNSMHTGNPAALWNHTGTDLRKRPTEIKGHSARFNFHFIFSTSNLHIRQRNAVYCGYKERRKSGLVLRITEGKQMKQGKINI